MGHIHAAAMAEYAKDALETDTPWERWEFCHMHGEYQSLHSHPEWVKGNVYRRKPQVILINGHEVPEPHRTPSHTPRALAAGQATAAQAVVPQGWKLVPVGWQFYEDGKWWNGDDRSKDHRKNTEEARYPIRDVYAVEQQSAQPDAAQPNSLESGRIKTEAAQQRELQLLSEIEALERLALANLKQREAGA